MTEDDFPEGTIFRELSEIYDGWSIAQLPDGTMINRWDKGTRRYVATEQWMKGEYHEQDINVWFTGRYRLACDGFYHQAVILFIYVRVEFMITITLPYWTYILIKVAFLLYLADKTFAVIYFFILWYRNIKYGKVLKDSK